MLFNLCLSWIFCHVRYVVPSSVWLSFFSVEHKNIFIVNAIIQSHMSLEQHVFQQNNKIVYIYLMNYPFNKCLYFLLLMNYFVRITMLSKPLWLCFLWNTKCYFFKLRLRLKTPHVFETAWVNHNQKTYSVSFY